MRKSIIALVATVAAFAAVESVNAQTSEQVVTRLVEKATVWKLSEGKKATSDAISAASARTNIFDDMCLQMAAPELTPGDSLMMEWREQMRRTATYGWGIGGTLGGIKMAENFSPTVGVETTYAGKRIMVGAGAELAISKYNNESTKSGKTFLAPIFSAKAGVVLTRFKLNGYNNQGYVAVGYEFKYILDKNENLAYESTTTQGNVTTKETQYFAVEGNSMCHCGFVEARFGLKHMGTTSIGVKAYGGVYNRYYIEGSRRKAMIGVSVSLYFSGAKKTTDKDVKALRTSLENGDYRLANEVINNLRANMK